MIRHTTLNTSPAWRGAQTMSSRSTNRKKSLEYLIVDTTKSCIENEDYVDSETNGTPRGQERSQECYSGKFPPRDEKDMDSGEGMPQSVRMERNLDVNQGAITENVGSVIEKEYCHLIGCMDDGIKWNTYKSCVTAGSGDVVFDMRHRLQCECVEVNYVENI